MFKNLIEPSKISIVQKNVFEIIQKEIENQVQLAKQTKKDDEFIKNWIDFKIIQDENYKLDAEEQEDQTIVNLFWSNVESRENSVISYRLTYDLIFDLYIIRNQTDEEKSYIANQRIDYLAIQIMKILGANENYFKGSRELIEFFRFQNLNKNIQVEKTTQAISFSRLEFSVGITEENIVKEGKAIEGFNYLLNIKK